MRLARGFFVFPFIFFISIACAVAQPKPLTKKARILLLLDGSSSMVDKWHGDKTRFKAAETVILALMDSIHRVNPDVEFGLRVFGHQHSVTERNCYDTKTEVFFNTKNEVQMSLRLAAIKPYGITPIAYSIQKSVEIDMMDDRKYAYSLILITDGGESCGGNICEVVRTMLEKKIYFKPYIISLFNSAELAQTYACMGEYMQVTTPADIGKTVKAILEAYRPMLKSFPASTPTLYEKRAPVESRPVETRPVEVPVVKEVPKPQPKPEPKVEPKPEPKPIPPPRLKEKLARITNTGLTQVKFSSYKRLDYPIVAVPKIKWPSEIVKTDMPRIALIGKPRKLPLLFTVPTHREVDVPRILWKEEQEEPMPVSIPKPAPKPVIEPKPITSTSPKPEVKPIPKPVVKETPKPKPVKKDPPKIIDVVAKVETEDAEETSVEVFFTNGKGKFYSTTPQILFKDMKSGETVHKFYRMVDAFNKPDPQKVPPGKYNVMIAGRATNMARNVTITANKKNKVIITITNGSLRFEYKDNPDRPVSEYVAHVSQRSGNINRDQNCDEESPYEPGSYHIIVNTQPLSHFYIDLDMSSTSSITIPEPGYVKFNSDAQRSKAALYTPLGDKYVEFMGVDVGTTVPVDSQKVRLNPGHYEVHFLKNSKTPGSGERVVPFTVNSNGTVEVDLK
jgi:cell division septation protein DedD